MSALAIVAKRKAGTATGDKLLALAKEKGVDIVMKPKPSAEVLEMARQRQQEKLAEMMRAVKMPVVDRVSPKRAGTPPPSAKQKVDMEAEILAQEKAEYEAFEKAKAELRARAIGQLRTVEAETKARNVERAEAQKEQRKKEIAKLKFPVKAPELPLGQNVRPIELEGITFWQDRTGDVYDVPRLRGVKDWKDFQVEKVADIDVLTGEVSAVYRMGATRPFVYNKDTKIEPPDKSEWVKIHIPEAIRNFPVIEVKNDARKPFDKFDLTFDYNRLQKNDKFKIVQIPQWIQIQMPRLVEEQESLDTEIGGTKYFYLYPTKDEKIDVIVSTSNEDDSMLEEVGVIEKVKVGGFTKDVLYGLNRVVGDDESEALDGPQTPK
jgi:hypothetical protein